MIKGSRDDWHLVDLQGQEDRWSVYGSGLTVAMPVKVGVRWLSLLPMANGSLIALDCTPGDNVMTLGELRPVDRAYVGPRAAQHYRAIDQGRHDLGTGTWPVLLHRAFQFHRLRPTYLDRGVTDGPPRAPHCPAWAEVLRREEMGPW